jgi:hypothetical protein
MMSPGLAASIAFWMLWPGPNEIIDAWAGSASIKTAKMQKMIENFLS